jgi:hypothetical protein
MTKPLMFDAAYAPSFKAVKQNGGIAVNSYISGMYQDTTSDPAAARKAGLGVVMTYEEGRSELVHAGRGDGQAVARKILAALEREGVPLDGSIAVYPSVDVSVAAADACDAAWRGLRDVLHGKVSVRYYGEGRVGDHLFDAGLLDGKYWLAAPSSWPGFDGTADTKRVCVVQLVGSPVHGTDQNVITDPHALGAWWPKGSPYAAAPAVTTPPTLLEELMTMPGAPKGLTYDQLLTAIADKVAASDNWRSGHDKYHAGYQLDTVIRMALADHAINQVKLAKAIAAALPTNAAAGLTSAELEAAVETGVRAVFADAGSPQQ